MPAYNYDKMYQFLSFVTWSSHMNELLWLKCHFVSGDSLVGGGNIKL